MVGGGGGGGYRAGLSKAQLPYIQSVGNKTLRFYSCVKVGGRSTREDQLLHSGLNRCDGVDVNRVC